MKSNYPNQIDTNKEIPIVRDNITEISSDVINSLRSAIINIEKTLGINPHGVTGQTLAERLNNIIDATGNLKPEVINTFANSNVSDVNISDNAGIKESKLDLNYPTNLLQSEISNLDALYNSLLEQLSEISAMLSIHISTVNSKAHAASSIYIEDADFSSSDESIGEIYPTSVQNMLEDIFSKHINYSGVNISSENNSHKSSQIYFDNTNVSTVIESTDVQGALEDLSNFKDLGLKNTILNLHSNGKINVGKVYDGYDGLNLGKTLLQSTDISYTLSTSGKTEFVFGTPITNIIDLKEFDILTLSGSTYDDDNKDYIISNIYRDGSGNIYAIKVYGGPLSFVSSGISITITKNTYQPYNVAGFLPTAKTRYNRSNIPDVVILNPDAPTIVSSNLMPQEITSLAHEFIIEVDGQEYSLSTYNSDLSVQTVDSIVQMINDQCSDQAINLLAYKIRRENSYELVLSHTVPNFDGDVVKRSLLVASAISNDGLLELGLSDYDDNIIYGTTNNSLHINGSVLSNFGIKKVFSNSEIQILTNNTQLQLYSGNFSDYGIRVGDHVIITNIENTSDNGTYRILTIVDDVVTLEGTHNFTNSLESAGNIIFLRNSVSLDDMTFEEFDGIDSSILFDVFMDENKDIFYKKRMEIDGVQENNGFFCTVTDVSKNFITSGVTATISINAGGFASLDDGSETVGDSVFIGYSGKYYLFNYSKTDFVVVDVYSTGLPLTTLNYSISGFDELPSGYFHIGRGNYSTSLGRILGSSNSLGIPVITDKRTVGTVDVNTISPNIVEKYIEGPRNELRIPGVVRGCSLVDAAYYTTYQTFSITPGVFYVNGIRHEFPGVTNYRCNNSQDIVIAFNKYGHIVAESYMDDPDNPGNNVSPFRYEDVCYIGEVTNNGSTITATYDLRVFINNLDNKVLNEIIVAQENYGHFTSIADAVEYSRRISKLFQYQTPFSIKIGSGTFEIYSTIYIDFDLRISGMGPNTILTRGSGFGNGVELSGSLVDMKTAIFMIGASSNTNDDGINYGVTLSDFTYITNPDIIYVGTALALSQPLEKDSVGVSRSATFRFENINFQGPSNMNGALSDPSKVGDYALILGQQNPNTLAARGNVVTGNAIINNCRFSRMGLENGAVRFLEESTAMVRDFVVNNCIITRGSPNLASDVLLIEYPTLTQLENVSETSISYRTGN